MDEQYYYSLRSILVYLTIAGFCMWVMGVSHRYELRRLRAAFSHFVACPRCRAGQTIDRDTQARAEAQHEPNLP